MELKRGNFNYEIGRAYLTLKLGQEFSQIVLGESSPWQLINERCYRKNVYLPFEEKIISTDNFTHLSDEQNFSDENNKFVEKLPNFKSSNSTNKQSVSSNINSDCRSSLKEQTYLEENLIKRGKERNNNRSPSNRVIESKEENASIAHPSELENWIYWLSAQLVERWRNLHASQVSVESLLNELGLGRVKGEILFNLDTTVSGISLSSEISSRINWIYNSLTALNKLLNPNLKKTLEVEVEKLTDWYGKTSFTPSSQGIDLGCIAELQLKAQELRVQRRIQLQKIFLSLQHLGSHSLLKLLHGLDAALESQFNYYELQRQEELRKEYLAQQGYYNWIKNLEAVNRFQADWKEITVCLNTLFQLKLKAETFNQACRLIGETREQIDFYINYISDLDSCLDSLQSWFMQQCLGEPFFAPLLKRCLDQQMNVSELLHETEETVGCPFNKWTSFSFEQNNFLKQNILDKVQPFCLSLYENCYHYLANIAIT